MTDIQRFKGNERMSSMVRYGHTLYVKGVTPSEAAGDDLADQTRDVLAQIEQLLQQGGSSVEQLLKVNIWVRDITEVEKMNEVYRQWVKPDHLPVRACVEAKMAKPGYRVEIQVEAACQARQ
ncbi:MAG: RidA family protein [Pseudomonadota bacterium]